MNTEKILVGWAEVDITPDMPVCLCGQFHARVSEGVKDPITATILVLEATGKNDRKHAVMVSCDLVAIPAEFKRAVVEKTKTLVPEIDKTSIIMNATHTHTAPESGGDILRGTPGLDIKDIYGVELPVMKITDYIEFAASKIAHGIQNAWEKRKESGIGYGLGYAVVGYNRRVSYYDGSSKMYGTTDDPQFSHIEGYEDHTLNIMGTWDIQKNLTGLIVNIACPSQVDEHLFEISADYWHDVKKELRRRFGENIFILAQCSAAGDQSPHILLCKKAYERMWNLSGRSERQDIAVRVADGIQRVLGDIEKDIRWQLEFEVISKKLRLKGFSCSAKDLKQFSKEAMKSRKEYERLKKEIDNNPEITKQPRWYRDITYHYRKYRWFQRCVEREKNKKSKNVQVEVHVVRLGDIVFATNPFELFLDYGIRIKAQSKAVQSFIVQLAGGGTYLPTEKAVKGKSYGAIGPSCMVGPEGGNQLVEKTLEIINNLW
ncbi:MAG TPA: hypothetical protein PK303_07645 [bacterium]|nr:hypothetical protein [bacterium]HOL35230.1 hypothetical protein [bacterium]HPP08975.1 hypothetical protein [bacterium]